MKITKVYSFKKGKYFLNKNHKKELKDIENVIKNTDALSCLTKVSQEKTKKGDILISPIDLNKSLKIPLCNLGWTKKTSSKKGFKEPRHKFGTRRFREMDGIKNKVGLEIQFGKYAFMGYDIFSKMPMFKNLGYIECGIEIVPDHDLCTYMSTGVSDFDQLMIDFNNRGESDIDIPVLVIALGLTDDEKERIKQIKLSNKKIKPTKNKGNLPGPK